MGNKIIYIAGYGRSGSTILDIVLANSENTSSVGAGSNILEWIVNNNLCSCGDKIRECAFWHDYKFMNISEEELKQKLQIQKRCERLFFPIYQSKQEYIDYINYTYQYIGKSTANIIDSSKTSYAVLFRPFLIKRYTNNDIKIVFLTRRLEEVLKSSLKMPGSPERDKDRGKFLTTLITIVSYIYTYIFTYLIFLTFEEESRIIVKFNDLKKAPEQELKRIGEKIGVNLSKPISILEDNNYFCIHHMVGGNRIRFKEKTKFKKKA